MYGLVQLTQYDVSNEQSQSGTVDETNPERGSRRDLAENAAQLVKVHRLRQMEIESSFSAALDVVTLCKA